MGVSLFRVLQQRRPGHLREGKTKAGLLAPPSTHPRRKERLKVSTSEPHLPPPL